MKTYHAELFLNQKHRLAESPFYDERTDTFSWVDITAGIFYRMHQGRQTATDFGEMIGAAIPTDPEGTYLVLGTKGIYRIDSEDQIEQIFDLTTLYDSNHRSNDAKCDPRGRIFFGSLSLSGEENGSLYSYDSGKIRVLEEHTKISNGMAWSKDWKCFYFSDSPYQKIFRYAYDAETGSITDRQVLCEITDGVPDGLTIDDQDNLWIAIWGGRRVEHRDGRTGELLGIIEVPAEQVSSCALYGENHDKLFITTSGDGVDGELDGCLFSCDIV